MSVPTPVTLHHHTENPYESLIGYSRAVRKGPFISVSGTTALDLELSTATSQVIKHPESAYKQALCIFREIVAAVEALGGKAEDVVRVRMYVTREEDADGVAKALRELTLKRVEQDAAEEREECLGIGGKGGPAATMLIGNKFVHRDMRVEIEADAIVL